jgi:hypothetical protein
MKIIDANNLTIELCGQTVKFVRDDRPRSFRSTYWELPQDPEGKPINDPIPILVDDSDEYFDKPLEVR